MDKCSLEIADTPKAWWKDYNLENKHELLAGGLPGRSVARSVTPVNRKMLDFVQGAL